MQNRSKDLYMSSVKIGPKGQIVIPKEAREMFGLQPGDTLILLADKNRGIALNRFEIIREAFERSGVSTQMLDLLPGKEEPNE